LDPLAALDSALGTTPTDISSGGAVVGTNGNPSTGLDLNSLFGNLLGSATTAYVANQQASQPDVIVPPATAVPGTVTIAGTSFSTTTLFFIGAGVLLFALVLRR